MKVETVLRQPNSPNCMPVAIVSQVFVLTCKKKKSITFSRFQMILIRASNYAWTGHLSEENNRQFYNTNVNRHSDSMYAVFGTGSNKKSQEVVEYVQMQRSEEGFSLPLPVVLQVPP